MRSCFRREQRRQMVKLPLHLGDALELGLKLFRDGSKLLVQLCNVPRHLSRYVFAFGTRRAYWTCRSAPTDSTTLAANISLRP